MKVLSEAVPSVNRSSGLFSSAARPDREAKEQPDFTVVFTPSTPMREIHDAVIQTVLRYTHGNRSQAAQLLQINPRTIRRHLGRKLGDQPATLAG